MNDSAIKLKIKEIIGDVAGLDPERIKDEDDVRKDLYLDSLLLLEIAVEVNLAFKLELPDERYLEIHSVSEMAELVLRRWHELELESSPEG